MKPIEGRRFFDWVALVLNALIAAILLLTLGTSFPEWLRMSAILISGFLAVSAAYRLAVRRRAGL